MGEGSRAFPRARAAAAGLVTCGVGIVGLGIWAALASRAATPTPALVATWLLAFVVMLGGLVAATVLAREGAVPRWVLPFVFGCSATAQLPLVFAPPALSDDLYRYVHDGRVLVAGINPYRHPPNAAALADVAGPETALVNHPEVRTVYPPLAEAVFGAAVILGVGATGLKATFGLCGLGLAALVARLSPRSQRHRCLAVAWHPLLIHETAGSGHLDVLGALFVLLAAWWLSSSKPGRAALALALGALVKLVPGAFAVAVASRLGLRRLSVVFVVAAVAATPPLLTPDPRGSQAGLAAYAEHWDFNGLAYPVVRAAVERVGLMTRLNATLGAAWPDVYRVSGPQYTSRALLGAAFVAFLAIGAWRTYREGPESDGVTGLGWAAAGFVLFSPTVQPWYLTWILPLAVLRSSPAWLYLSGAVGLSYASALAAGGEAWQELTWPRVIEYLPFLALLIGAEIRRRVRSPILPESPAGMAP